MPKKLLYKFIFSNLHFTISSEWFCWSYQIVALIPPHAVYPTGGQWLPSRWGMTWRKPISLPLQHTYLEVVGSNPVTRKKVLAQKSIDPHAHFSVVLYLLQNCHLSLAFCDELMQTVIDSDEVHANFRIWLTTEVNEGFPIGLLQVRILSSWAKWQHLSRL